MNPMKYTTTTQVNDLVWELLKLYNMCCQYYIHRQFNKTGNTEWNATFDQTQNNKASFPCFLSAANMHTRLLLIGE